MPATFYRPPKSVNYSGSELEFIEDNFGRGRTGGAGEVKTRGGSIPDDNGKIKIAGTPSTESGKDGSKTILVSNLRINHSNETAKMAKIFFDANVSGDFNLSVHAVGEHGSEVLPLIANNQETKALKVSVEAGKRHSLEIGFVNSASSFVLEAKLNEI